MKKNIFSVTCFVIFIALWMLGCDDDKKGREDNILSVKDLTHTECKFNTDKERVAKSEEYLQLKAESNYLAVFHVDAEFNCCPVELLVDTSIEGTTIIIDEKDKEQGCKCLCKYDLDYKVGTLDYRKYHIVFKKRGKTVYEFDLDYNTETDEKIVLPSRYMVGI